MCPTEFPANLVWQPASSRTGSSKWWRFGGLFWSQSVYMSQNKTNWCCPEAFKVHMTPQNVLFRWRRRCKSISISNDQNMRQTTHCFPASCSSGKKKTATTGSRPKSGQTPAAKPGLPSSSISIPTSSRMDSAKKFWSQNLRALDRVPFVWCRNMSKHNGKAERQQEVAWDESQFLEFIQTM